jgi:hypothetical protein
LLGGLQADEELRLSTSWLRPVPVRCGERPGSVALQEPAPGAVLTSGTVVEIRTAALDLQHFRGPCEPPAGDLGPVRGPDSVIARQFYRFAADPSLGAPFVDGEVWTGLENGPTGRNLGVHEQAQLAA